MGRTERQPIDRPAAGKPGEGDRLHRFVRELDPRIVVRCDFDPVR